VKKGRLPAEALHGNNNNNNN
jgi:hypothetical protein